MIESINRNQIGFIPNLGCEIHLQNIMAQLLGRRKGKKNSFIAFYDFSKAFDSLNHEILFKKLSKVLGNDSDECKLLK